MNVWVTLGCFNLFVRIDATSKGQQAERELLAWAKREKIPYEKWTVKNGEVGQATTYSLPNAYPINLIKELLALSKVGDDIPAIRMTLQEYCALVASAATRSSIILPTLYIEVQQVAERIKQVFEKYNEGKLIPLEVHSMLISMNAALSRFSSQALSGTPPIIGTECHYWTHSLLGTGSANIALATLVRHIHRVLGEARIPERIAALKTKKNNVPDLDRLTSGPDLLSVDHIKITTPIGDGGPIAPLVTYFSGRDGFSSHLQTLSAPLTCIAECNSYRSNLMTVTHEISHIFMQGVLAQLYPNFDDITGISELQEMARPHFRATNWYDAVRQPLVEAIISMEQVRKGHANEMSPEDIVPTPDSLAKLLSYWRREAQEIMVHTFDFRYFYSGDPAIYIKTIWHSWCAIAGIADRVPEYVLRTLCAISSKLLKENFELTANSAKEQTETALRRLVADDNLMSDYASRALIHLGKNWNCGNGSIIDAYRARLYLVRLVTAFLFSESIAAQIYHEPNVARGSDSGYDKKVRQFDLNPIASPLRFLGAHLSPSPSVAESLWVLQNLAFNTEVCR
jgi:hypothetical protein